MGIFEPLVIYDNIFIRAYLQLNIFLLMRQLTLTITLLFFFFGQFISAQSYKSMIEAGTYSVQEVIDSAYAYFKDRDTGRGTGYKQFKRWEYMALRLQDENGYLKSDEYYIKELEQFDAAYNSQRGSRALGDFWSDMGPTSWRATSGWNPGLGRVTGLDVDPADPNHIIIGAQTGGVWKTYDGGSNWEPLNDYFSNMAVYSVAIHPEDKNTYYFGSDGGRFYRSVDAGNTWVRLGNIGGSLVNRIVFHPDDPSRMFACSQGTGIFRSDNGGQNWTAITDDTFGYDVEINTEDPNIVYASGSAFHRSIDGGFTFTTIRGELPLKVTGDAGFARDFVVADNGFTNAVSMPVAPDKLEGELVPYLDAESNTNLGCGPASNTEDLAGKIVLLRRGECTFVVKALRAQEAGAIGVIIANNVPGTATMGGDGTGLTIPVVSVGRDEGTSLFTALQNQKLFISLSQVNSENFSTGAKMIGVTKADPNRVYVLEASGSVFNGLYKSDDGGLSFEKLDHEGKNYFGYSTEAADDRGQAPRDMDVAVNHTDADEVHVAGINTWVSFDGGITMRPTSDWVPNSAISKGVGYCHADVDILVFLEDKLYAGTDGGIFRVNETKTVNRHYYEDLSAGLGIRQFYRIGISQTDPVVVSGGSQDNGTSAWMDDRGWIDWLGADGMETFIDKFNPNLMFGTSQNGAMYFTTNRGNSYSGISRPGSGSGRWVTPFEQDPILDNTIYVGYEAVFRSTNRGGTWTAISQDFPEKLDHLKIAPLDNSIMYAAYGGNLFRTKDGGATNWQRLTGFSGNINEIAIHPTYNNKIAIATTASQKVFVSEDGGDTWSSYRKNLPDFPALSLVWQDNLTLEDLDGLYVGMNYGIYYIDNSMQEWAAFNTNIPNVIINELEINYVDGHLYAATYGRGLWKSPLVDQTTSTKQADFSHEVTIFPNPTDGNIVIQWKGLENQLSDLRVFDLQGRLILYQPQVDMSNHTVTLNNLNSGVYFIRCSNARGTVVKQIIKQ